MELKLLKTKQDFKKALARVAVLTQLEPVIGSPEYEEIRWLGMLIADFERSQKPLPWASDPVVAIEQGMARRKLNPFDLIPIFGTQKRVFEVLKRKRRLSLAAIIELNQELGIPSEILLKHVTKSGR